MLVLRIFLFLFFAALAAGDPSVIVIGTGASGIAAATRLLKNGFTNITLLEAEDRIGGRVYSVEFGGSYVDLGAEWCHGEQDNVVYEMVKDLKVLGSGLQSHLQLHHSSLKQIDSNFSDTLMEIFVELIEEKKDTGSLGEYMVKRYKEIIGQWEHDEDKYALAQQALETLEHTQNSIEGSFSWYDVAAGGDYVNCPGDDNLHWNGHGYKTILEVLMQKYPYPSKALPIDNKVLLKKEVEQIDWSSKPVVVKCTDGTTYSADHVIVTVSLGVLKHQHNAFFKPQLPADKVEAIDQLGFAAVHKVLFHFPEKWWNNTDPGRAFVWDKNDAKNSTFKTKDGTPWITALWSVVTMPHNPNVLEGWICGDLTPEIEQMADDTIIDGLMHILDFFGVVDSKNLVRPDAIVRNKWYSNPHFRGTYSFQTPRSRQGSNSDEVILSRPLGNDVQKPNLLFAGEATNPKHYSTVHGAIETGFREADRIIKMYL